MNILAELLTTEDIVIAHDVTNKDNLLESAAQFFEWRHGVYAPLVLASLQTREKLGSTGIGHGVAIPHARIKPIDATRAALFLIPHGIDFEAIDGWPVKIALFLLVPEHVNQAHLNTLAATAKLFSEKSFRSKLLSCHSAKAIHQAIMDEPV